MMNDTELARKMRRVPSIDLPALRGVIAFLEVTREDPKKPVADELAELSLIAQRTAEAGAALTRLGWYGEREFIAAYPGGENIWDAFRQLAAIGGACAPKGRGVMLSIFSVVARVMSHPQNQS